MFESHWSPTPLHACSTDASSAISFNFYSQGCYKARCVVYRLSTAYCQTSKYRVTFIFNHHSFNFHLANGWSYQINKHQRWLVLSTESRLHFQIVFWTADGFPRASSAPVDICFLAQSDSIVTDPAVLPCATSCRWCLEHVGLAH